MLQPYLLTTGVTSDSTSVENLFFCDLKHLTLEIKTIVAKTTIAAIKQIITIETSTTIITITAVTSNYNNWNDHINNNNYSSYIKL